MASLDKSNGYEAIAPAFTAGRGRNARGIGARVVAAWSHTLPESASVLDLGCGTGVPITLSLLERGFSVYAVDASPSMAAAFRNRFPRVPMQCAGVEDSDFFSRAYDGVIAWGLFFLLSAEAQRGLIAKIGAILRPGGRLLFTAPSSVCSWSDGMTGQTSISLGYRAYRQALEAEGMSLTGVCRDEGGNHYYDARKTAEG